MSCAISSERQELKRADEWGKDDKQRQKDERKALERNQSYLPQNVLGRMVARQTGYYWGTSGHTPEPVAVGAMGPGAELFRGYQDNTDFGKHLHRLIQGK